MVCQAWKIRFKDLQLVILCPQNWSSLNASPSPAGLLLIFILVPSICHLLTISPSTTYPFIYLCMHPCIHPSLPLFHLSIHLSHIHLFNYPSIHPPSILCPFIQPPSVIYHARVYPPAIVYSSLSIHPCTIYPCIWYLPICLPSTHHQSSIHPSNHRSTAILHYVRLATHPYVYHLPIHPPIHPLSILPSIIHPLSVHHMFIITLRGARCSSALREPPVCWGSGAGRQCALSPRCPHCESSCASSVASRAGEGSRAQRPQAGRQERAVSWLS